MQSGLQVRLKRVGYDRVARMLFDIVGDLESFKNVKNGLLHLFAETILCVAQKKLHNHMAIVFVGGILGRESSERQWKVV